MRYVRITTYAKMVGIKRTSVYKRIKSGRAVLLADCEAQMIDLWQSAGTMKRNDWQAVKAPELPAWVTSGND